MKAWICDMCGNRIKEGDAGFASKYPVKIEIPLNGYESKGTYSFNDTCYNCRMNIIKAIEKELEKNGLK